MSKEAQIAPGQIVVGVDGSSASKEALRWAVKLAPALNAGVHALVAWEYPPAVGVEGSMPSSWRPDETANEILEQTFQEVFEGEIPKNVQSSTCQGSPIFVLLDNSKEAQMLIVGSRGLGSVAGLLLGSISAACAEHAECPVLVVHEKAKEDSR